MLARDLAEPFPTVTADSDAMAAARAMAAGHLPGLIVCENDVPVTVLPGSQVLRFLIPRYVQDDAALARALDADASDQLCRQLNNSTVRDLLPASRHQDQLPVVDGDATALETAAVMAQSHSPLAAVVVDGKLVGAITVARLLDYLLPPVEADA